MATLSVSTNVFPPAELLDCLEFCAKLGMAAVEVGPRNRLDGDSRTLAGALAAFDLFGVRPLSMHAWTQVEGLEEVCEFAPKLGTGLIVVHCRHEKITGDFANQVAMLTHWDAWCRRRGIVLTVENSSKQPLEPFVELFEAIPGLRLTLDVKHAYKPETLGLTHKDYMAKLADRLANFHISGIDRARDELGDGCPPGNDAVDWTELADDLSGRQYGGLITMELNFPAYLTPERREELYSDLPPVSNELPTLGHRLMKHAVDYYREALAPCLQRGSAE